MPETKSRFLNRIIDEKGADEAAPFTKERQHTAQAFNLHVERKDGRRTEGFAWSHYAGYQWTDEGSVERLVVLFGDRAVEIEGQNLGVLVNDIREGQLNKVRELTSGQKTLLEQAAAEDEPIIASVRTFPDFEEVL